MTAFVPNPSRAYDAAHVKIREAIDILRECLENGHAQQEHGACLHAERCLRAARGFYVDWGKGP